MPSGTSSADAESTNTSVTRDRWFCFAHNSGAGALELVAVIEGLVECGDVPKRGGGCLDDELELLLRACLAARDKYGVVAEDATPPYRALVAVAKEMGLSLADEDEEILGGSAHAIAASTYKSMEYDG